MNTKGLRALWQLTIFQILTAFLASAASIPTTFPNTPTIPECIVPKSEYVDITIRSCQPALDQLMLRPDSSRRVEYQWEGHAIRLTGALCIISLDCTGPCPELLVSAREITGYAYRILAYCQVASMGWMRIEGARSWLVSVMGAAKWSAVMNATIGEFGNNTLVEDQGEQDSGLIETS